MYSATAKKIEKNKKMKEKLLIYGTNIYFSYILLCFFKEIFIRNNIKKCVDLCIFLIFFANE